MKKDCPRESTKGVTLFEILLVTALLALFLLLPLPYLRGTREKTALETERNKFASTLEYARQQSIAAYKGHAYSVEIDQPNNRYTLQPTGRTYKLPEKMSFSQPVGITTIEFAKLTGKTIPAVNIVIQFHDFECKIDVSSEGLMNLGIPEKI